MAEMLYRVEIDGVDVSDRVVDLSITLERDQPWVAATISFADLPVTEGVEMVIEYGAWGDEGFVYSVSASTTGMVDVEYRSVTALLDAPFYQPKTTVVWANTAGDLLDWVQSETGGAIDVWADDPILEMEIGGSYELSEATLIDVIRNIAEVSGGELYYVFGRIYIFQPFSQIVGDWILGAIEIPNLVEAEIVEERTIESDRVGIVRVGTEESFGYDRQCNFETVSGTVFCAISPWAEPDAVSGAVSYDEAERTAEFVQIVHDTDTVELAGDVVEIVKCSVDTTEYDPETLEIDGRFVTFPAPVSGAVSILYRYRALRIVPTITQSRAGGYYAITVEVGGQKCRFDGFFESFGDSMEAPASFVVDARENGSACSSSPYIEIYGVGDILTCSVYDRMGNYLDVHPTYSGTTRDYGFMGSVQQDGGGYYVQLPSYFEAVDAVEPDGGGYTVAGDRIVFSGDPGTAQVFVTGRIAGKAVSLNLPSTFDGGTLRVYDSGRLIYQNDITYAVREIWDYRSPDTCNCGAVKKILHNWYELTGVPRYGTRGAVDLVVDRPCGVQHVHTTEFGDFVFDLCDPKDGEYRVIGPNDTIVTMRYKSDQAGGTAGPPETMEDAQ